MSEHHKYDERSRVGRIVTGTPPPKIGGQNTYILIRPDPHVTPFLQYSTLNEKCKSNQFRNEIPCCLTEGQRVMSHEPSKRWKSSPLNEVLSYGILRHCFEVFPLNEVLSYRILRRCFEV